MQAVFPLAHLPGSATNPGPAERHRAGHESSTTDALLEVYRSEVQPHKMMPTDADYAWVRHTWNEMESLLPPGPTPPQKPDMVEDSQNRTDMAHQHRQEQLECAAARARHEDEQTLAAEMGRANSSAAPTPRMWGDAAGTSKPASPHSNQNKESGPEELLPTLPQEAEEAQANLGQAAQAAPGVNLQETSQTAAPPTPEIPPVTLQSAPGSLGPAAPVEAK